LRCFVNTQQQVVNSGSLLMRYITVRIPIEMLFDIVRDAGVRKQSCRHRHRSLELKQRWASQRKDRFAQLNKAPPQARAQC
jgi:hypothetical protein